MGISGIGVIRGDIPPCTCMNYWNSRLDAYVCTRGYPHSVARMRALLRNLINE